MACPFCQSSSTGSTVYPKMSFNNKLFEYRRCKNCALDYLDPLPVADDYLAMYPPSYQGDSTDSSILPDIYQKMPGLRFSYGYQFDLVKKNSVANPKILDYGCGNGHFIANAIARNFVCDGAEFSAAYVNVLKTSFPKSSFFTIDEILSGQFHRKYDVIRLSNVLEHLTTPGDVIRSLMQHLNPGGVLLVEGPVEGNFNLAASFRKGYFGVQR
ncbi:MAG: class I SAM-dependent methyltransferase, partial [Chitinophagaceae bacterium]